MRGGGAPEAAGHGLGQRAQKLGKPEEKPEP